VRLFRAVREGAKHIAALRGRWQLKREQEPAAYALQAWALPSVRGLDAKAPYKGL